MSIDAAPVYQVKAYGFGRVPTWLWLSAGVYVLSWSMAAGSWAIPTPIGRSPWANGFSITGLCRASMSIPSASLASPGFRHPGLRKSFMP